MVTDRRTSFMKFSYSGLIHDPCTCNSQPLRLHGICLLHSLSIWCESRLFPPLVWLFNTWTSSQLCVNFHGSHVWCGCWMHLAVCSHWPQIKAHWMEAVNNIRIGEGVLNLRDSAVCSLLCPSHLGCSPQLFKLGLTFIGIFQTSSPLLPSIPLPHTSPQQRANWE